MMKYSLFLLFTMMLFAGCQKELSFEYDKQLDPGLSKETSRSYRLSAFYSDIPIDFVENDDEIKSETDLWGYVKEYLKDDINEFFVDSTLVIVHQNVNKIEGNDEPLLRKDYRVGNDSNGRYMKFLGPEYEPLQYLLQEMNDDYFIVYLDWKHGSKIFSRFDRIR
ncbi:MAG TPA: hypothetical protein VM101_11205 [Flavitalea sp.]|nr:hypothetical protein [Flavitalea sp.]